MNKNLIFLAVLALIFGACNDDDEGGKTIVKKKKLTITSSVNALVTKAGNTTESLDEIGLFVTPSDPAQTEYVYTNAVLFKESSSSTWIPTNLSDNSMYTLYWCPTIGATTDIIAYSPYIESAKLTEPIAFSVKEDQSNKENVRVSDLLYGTKTGATPNENNYKVNLNLEHLGAKFVVPLSLVSDLASESVDSLKLGGVIASGSLTLTDGALSVSGNPTEISMYYNSVNQTYECIILPQTVAAGSLFIAAYLSDGRSYESVFPDAYTFEKGNLYSYEVSVGIGLTYTHTIRAMGWNRVIGDDLYFE